MIRIDVFVEAHQAPCDAQLIRHDPGDGGDAPFREGIALDYKEWRLDRDEDVADVVFAFAFVVAPTSVEAIVN